jgi:hypothetical protein
MHQGWKSDEGTSPTLAGVALCSIILKAYLLGSLFTPPLYRRVSVRQLISIVKNIEIPYYG